MKYLVIALLTVLVGCGKSGTQLVGPGASSSCSFEQDTKNRVANLLANTDEFSCSTGFTAAASTSGDAPRFPIDPGFYGTQVGDVYHGFALQENGEIILIHHIPGGITQVARIDMEFDWNDDETINITMAFKNSLGELIEGLVIEDTLERAENGFTATKFGKTFTLITTAFDVNTIPEELNIEWIETAEQL